MKNIKVLVTGANGQVGFELVQRFKGNVDLLALDRHSLDISNAHEVDEVITRFRPDVIVNAAAYTSVDNAEIEVEQAKKINEDGPRYLAVAATKVGAIVIHISTDYVFSGEKLTSYIESDIAEPSGIYGKTKLAGEMEVAKFCHRHIILRTAWVFGKHGSNFVKTMLRLGMTKSEIGVVADQFGAPTYAGDIADVIVHIATMIIKKPNMEAWGTYHFCGYPYVSWFEFAKAIFEASNISDPTSEVPILNPIQTQDYPTRAKRPHNSRLDCLKIKRAFNVSPSAWQNALVDINSYKVKNEIN